jgi:hypothetical protein
VLIVRFKVSQAGIEKLALGHDDNVDARCDLVSTENLSNQSFSSVSLDRTAHLARCRDAQPAPGSIGGKRKKSGETAMDLGTPAVNLLKLGAPSNAFTTAEARHAISC